MQRTTASLDSSAMYVEASACSRSVANKEVSVRHATPNVRPPLPPFSKTSLWKTSGIVYGRSLFQKCYDPTSCEIESF